MLDAKEKALVVEALIHRMEWCRENQESNRVPAYEKLLRQFTEQPEFSERDVDFRSKVLLIDDVKSMRQLVTAILRDIGFSNITELDSGEAAWKQLDRSPESADLLFCDWTMAGMTGLELLEKLRADERFATMPFFMVTALNDLKNIQQAMSAGVSDYIIKPFNQKTIREKVERFFKLN